MNQLKIVIPTRVSDTFDVNGSVIVINIDSCDDDDLFTTTCNGWDTKWHHCPYSSAHKRIRVVNNSCLRCYTSGSPVCDVCEMSNIQLNTIKSREYIWNDRYHNKLNTILCHHFFKCPPKI